jgi:hypothetical protein
MRAHLVSVNGATLRITHPMPAMPAGAVVGALAHEQGVDHARLELVRLGTDEGEHAVLATVRPALGPVLPMGVVYADDLCLAMSVERADDARAAIAAIERNVRGSHLGLPRDRRRAFFYEPPAGWHPRPAEDAHAWVAPGGRHGRLVVWRARPSTSSAKTIARKLMFGVPTNEPQRICAANPLEGVLLSARNLSVIVVVLSDGRFVHAIRLEPDARHTREDLETLVRLVESIEPLPLRSRGELASVDRDQALEPWNLPRADRPLGAPISVLADLLAGTRREKLVPAVFHYLAG